MKSRGDARSRMMAIYREHAGVNPSSESQMCLLWSVDDPPDVLLCTDPLDAIEAEFHVVFTEDEAAEMYDMNLVEALIYVENIVAQQMAEDS